MHLVIGRNHLRARRFINRFISTFSLFVCFYRVEIDSLVFQCVQRVEITLTENQRRMSSDFGRRAKIRIIE